MPHTLKLSASIRKSGWRGKIFDDEGPEEPHVTIHFKTEKWWRVSLRVKGTFLYPGGRWSEIPKEIQDAIDLEWDAMRAYWTKGNPSNPV